MLNFCFLIPKRLDLDNSRQEPEAISARVVALYGRAESRHLKVDTVSD